MPLHAVRISGGVNLGNDADTTGAIYGQLAGAFYGAEQIPPKWRTKLAMHDFVVETADQLVQGDTLA